MGRVADQCRLCRSEIKDPAALPLSVTPGLGPCAWEEGICSFQAGPREVRAGAAALGEATPDRGEGPQGLGEGVSQRTQSSPAERRRGSYWWLQAPLPRP